MKQIYLTLLAISLFLPAIAEQTENTETRLSKLEKIIKKLPDISGYLNMRYQYNDLDGGSNSFDIRRARLVLQGNISPKIDYRLQIEFAHTPKILDAYMQWKPLQQINIKAGQYKLPFSLENPYSPLNLETADNSQIINALIPYENGGGGRDMGAGLWGGFVKKDGYNLIDYNIGIFNGSGINNFDNNKKKSFAGIFSIHPIKNLTIAVSYYNGGITTEGQIKNAARVGGGVLYDDGRWLFRGEYIGAKTGNLRSGGCYAVGGYYFIPKKLQGVLKFDNYQRDIHNKNTRSNHYIAGLNYNIIGKTRVQINYAYRDNLTTGSSNYVVLQLFAAF